MIECDRLWGHLNRINGSEGDSESSAFRQLSENIAQIGTKVDPQRQTATKLRLFLACPSFPN